MFWNAHSFNQPIKNWNVSNIEDMNFMFAEAKSFNQQLNNWNVSNVAYKNCMFKKCPIRGEYKPIFNK